MRYSITFPQSVFDRLTQHLFLDRKVERAAYLLCSISVGQAETRLLGRDVIFVAAKDIERATKHDIVIKQDSYRPVLKRADQTNSCFIFIHSHPEGFPEHSEQDDKEEIDFFKTVYTRIHNDQLVHGSIVFSDPRRPIGRVWFANGRHAPIDRVRVIGERFSFFDRHQEALFDLATFDRQIRAFGEDLQGLLSRLKIGIVGLGGTGSAVCEQLTRLGVGHLMLCDPQLFEKSNTNRVYGSSIEDDGNSKTSIAHRNIDHIGIGTVVEVVDGSSTELRTAQPLKECDIIFGCTDDEWGRAVLTKLAISYFVPVFDMGVEVESENESIINVRGRVTTLLPNSPCLFCRGVITPDIIAAEVLHKIHPEEYERRRKEGYVPGLPGNAPAVIMFTSATASTAISELLHRLTGYMGESRSSTEVVLRFDESKISTNSKIPKQGCWCADYNSWGRGDEDPFLGLTWIEPGT
jgi:proteasome lid subunit RPN8/RPN11